MDEVHKAPFSFGVSELGGKRNAVGFTSQMQLTTSDPAHGAGSERDDWKATFGWWVLWGRIPVVKLNNVVLS